MPLPSRRRRRPPDARRTTALGTTDIVVMGRVAAPYGVKGWLKVLPSTSDFDTLLEHEEWWLRRRGDTDGWRKCTLESGKAHGNTLLVQLSGLGDREAAAVFAGGEVGIARANLPAAKAGEIYFADLVGLDVTNRAGEHLGRVAEVQEFGAHPVLRVVDDAGTARLIPFVPSYIDAVAVAEGRIEVDWQKDY
jgi:16S rRNA processing protein RimM